MPPGPVNASGASPRAPGGLDDAAAGDAAGPGRSGGRGADTIPNFFIVGAPKCGTTSLAAYLDGHPRVFMSSPKEPNFFCEDLPDTRAVTSLDDYLELFPTEDPPPVVGEASTWYLYSNVALRKIRRFNPDARVCAMVRNPVELAYSLHSQLVFNQIETEEDFEEAWRLQSERRERSFLQYEEVASIGTQVEELFEVFPEDQSEVVLLDDFAEATRTVYRRVLDHAGVAPDDRESFPVLNRNKESRSSWLSRFIRETPPPVVRAVRLVKELLSVEKLGILKKLRSANTRERERPPLRQGFRKELVEVFRPEIRKLEDLLDRDLGGWREVGSS